MPNKNIRSAHIQVCLFIPVCNCVKIKVRDQTCWEIEIPYFSTWLTESWNSIAVNVLLWLLTASRTHTSASVEEWRHYMWESTSYTHSETSAIKVRAVSQWYAYNVRCLYNGTGWCALLLNIFTKYTLFMLSVAFLVSFSEKSGKYVTIYLCTSRSDNTALCMFGVERGY